MTEEERLLIVTDLEELEDAADLYEQAHTGLEMMYSNMTQVFSVMEKKIQTRIRALGLRLEQHQTELNLKLGGNMKGGQDERS